MLKTFYRFLHPKFQNVFLEYKVDQRPRYGHGQPPHPGLGDIISKGEDGYSDLLTEILKYKEDIWSIADRSIFGLRWDNDFLPGLDIAALYGLIAHLRPVKYMEIGSGYSTMVAYQAKVDHGLDTEIISIDPEPRAAVDQLADRVVRASLETVDLDIIDQLSEGNILFIDNSHRILPNSDCTVFFLEILPRLKPGVIVHIHDIYLPYDYPQFMCDRFYSEQYGLAIALLSNPAKFEILLPNYYISEDKGLASVIAPVWQHPQLENVERHGGSFWFRVAK